MVKAALGHKKTQNNKMREKEKESKKGKGKLFPVATHEKKQQGCPDKHPSRCVFSDAAGDSPFGTLELLHTLNRNE